MLYYNQGKGKTKKEERTKMKAYNEIEAKVLEMINKGEKLTGPAREIAIEMLLREQERKEA